MNAKTFIGIEMEMKICTRCQGEFDKQKGFYKQRQVGPKGQVWDCTDSFCKNCRKEYTNQRREEVKLQIVEFLGGKCAECGVIDDPIVYDCHHLDPTKKDFSFGKVNLVFEKLKSELEKCILLCSNCHRKHHKRHKL